MNMVLDKVILRQPEPKDIEFLYKYKNDWELIKDLVGASIGYSHRDIEDWIEFHRKRTDEVVWVIADKEDDHCIGHKGLYQIDYKMGSARTGMFIGDKSYWGKRVGSQVKRAVINFAFDTLRLHRIESLLIAGKMESVRLNESCGFTKEGLLRHYLYKNGKYLDIEIWSLLDEEWRAWREKETREKSK